VSAATDITTTARGVETSPPRSITAREALGRAGPLLATAAPRDARRPVLVVSDFDGTLSQIVDDPWAASMLPLARRSLRTLVGTPGVHVAVLSGRTALDVAARARVGGVTYLGNHGLERGLLPRRQRAERLSVDVKDAERTHADLAERLAERVPDLVREPWLVVERKAPAVAFHYRRAPDVPAAAAQVKAAVDRLDPAEVLVRFPGRRVLELRPPGATAKGEAMRELLDEVRPRVCFMLGDDRSDALAFGILIAAREAGETEGLAIAVQALREAPLAVAEAADLLLASPIEAARFLAGLARSLRAEAHRERPRAAAAGP
jgi:trehalose-phosphatase